MYFSNAASRLAGAILEHMALAGEEKFFYYSRCTLQEIWERKRSRHKTAQAVSDRRVCEIIPRLYRSTGCKSSEKNMRNVILSRKKHKKVVY